MQGTGQPSGVIPGSAGPNAYNALLFQAQGQLPGGQAIFAGAPRLALVQGGSRPTAVNAAALAAAAQGAAYRAPPMHPSMLKPPPRKTGGGGQQKGRKHCNCKNSRCLKLYCECFASGRYCDNCNCVNCFNNKESEAVRQSAVEAILERNPNAFRPKIQTAEGDTHPQSIRNAPDGTVRHTKGCNCKKSSCLKKYCECFQGGIFCTEICKCVDCKNYDGSEARAQVLSIQHDPFNLHQLHQAAAAHAAQTAIKRQRLQVQQPLLQQGGQAGLLQAHNALQQLAVAAAAGGPGAPSMPLQQLQALSAAAAAPAAPAAAAATAAPPPPPAPPPRHPLLDVVHDLVKPNVIEELCQLLILVAKEEADKQQQQQQQAEQQEQQQQQDDTVQKAATPTTDGLLNGVKQEDEHESSIAAPAPAPAGTADDADMETEQRQQQQQGVKADADAVDADGDSEMQEAKPLLDGKQQQEQQEQRDGSAAPGQPAASQPAALSDAYTAQEAVVLQEFNAILQRIIAQADKKANSLAAANAAAAAAAAATTAATAAGRSSTAAATPAAAAAATSQAPPASTAAAAGEAADKQQQQQQQQQPKPVGQPMAIRPPVLAFQQQQAVMFANPNLALQLQASRQAAFMSNVNAAAMAAAAGGTGSVQQLAAYPGGLGMHLQGLRPMGMNMQQMVQVLAQDGSVHHIPAASLMSLLPTAQAAPAAAPQAAAVSAAMPAASAAPPAAVQGLGAAAAAATAGGAAPPASAAPTGAGVSMLSLLNSAINTGTSNAAGGGL